MISVIIATYNYGQYLPEALLSLQQQSYADWECIIVDDGSTDNTNSIVQPILQNDHRFSYVVQKNAGPAVARNRGLDLAKGSHVLFLDADDKLEQNKLESHLLAFKLDDKLDIAYGDVRYFYNGDEITLFYSMRPDNKPWTTHFSGMGNDLVDELLRRNVMVTSAPLIKRSAIAKSGAFDPVIHKLEDWDLFQRFALANLKFQFVDTPSSLVLMRAHPGSFSYSQKGMRRYYLPLIEKHLLHSRLTARNRIYLIIRILEEYTEILLLWPFGKLESPLHYTGIRNWMLLPAAVLFFPLYLLIKLIRLTRPSNE